MLLVLVNDGRVPKLYNRAVYTLCPCPSNDSARLWLFHWKARVQGIHGLALRRSYLLCQYQPCALGRRQAVQTYEHTYAAKPVRWYWSGAHCCWLQHVFIIHGWKLQPTVWHLPFTPAVTCCVFATPATATAVKLLMSLFGNTSYMHCRLSSTHSPH